MPNGRQLMELMLSASEALFKKVSERAVSRVRNEKMDALMRHVHSSERHSYDRVAKAVDAVRSKKKMKA